MQPFSTHSGKVMPLDRVNVDTDQLMRQRIRLTGIQLFAVGFVVLVFYYLGQNARTRWFQLAALVVMALGIGFQLAWFMSRHRSQPK